jgi:hypothetical protein
VFGAGKPFADDQADDMMKEKKGLAIFDKWVTDFAHHVETKGPMPDIKDDERGAETTTNQEKRKI